MSTNTLVELAEQTWLRLEKLLLDLDENDQERQSFVNDTRIFFEQRLSVYQSRKIELEKRTKDFLDEIYRLRDQLRLPKDPIEIDENLSIREQQNYLEEQIQNLRKLLDERDKELIQLRHVVALKAKLIGNIELNTEQITCMDEAESINNDLSNRLAQLKIDIQKCCDLIHNYDPVIAEKHIFVVQSYVLLKEESYSSWLNKYHPLNGFSLYHRLQTEYQNLHQTLLDEVVRLRRELEQSEPTNSIDLKQELEDLRLRQRYFLLLKGLPHRLTSRSNLDEIRQTYEQLTASLRAKAREKLTYLWDQLDFPTDQRIIPKTQNNDDDYLAMNEEIQRLEKYVESIRPVLTKIQKREWYKKEMVEFEKRAGDPARLRGSSTQLLKEEKFRKDLSKEFPKLTDDLRQMVAEWEDLTGQKLVYGGKPYLETMNEEKLSVDFELLHLRLLTKCQILVQPEKSETISDSDSISTRSSIVSTPVFKNPTSPVVPIRTNSSRIPMANPSISNRKLQK